MRLTERFVSLQSEGPDVVVPDQTTGQLWFSFLAAAALILALLIAYRRTRLDGLSPAQRRHKMALLGAKRDQTPETVHIPAGAPVSDYRDDIVQAFERVFQRTTPGETAADVAHDPDRVTIREALRTVAAEAWATTDDALPPIPRTAQHIGSVAILVGLLGALAVSTDRLVAALGTDASQALTLGPLIADATELTVTVIETALVVVEAFPLADVVVAVGILTVALVGTTLYTHYYVVSAVLVLAAVGIVLVERSLPDDVETHLYSHDRSLVVQSVGVLATVWLAGVLPAGLGALIGDVGLVVVTVDGAAVGAGIGALASLAVALLALGVALRSFLRRVRHAARIDWTGGPDALLALYLVGRYLAVGIAFVAAPLIPVYVGVIVFRGRLAAVLTAYWSADPLVQLLVFGAVLGLCALVWRLARAAHADVYAAVSETLARHSIRVAILQRGVTVATMLLAGAVLWSFSRSVSVTAIGTVVLGVLVYGGYALLDRAAYRVRLWGRVDPAASTVLVRCYALPDADDERHAVAVVTASQPFADANPISRPSIEATATDVCSIVDAVRTPGDRVPKTIGERRASDLLELGIVDADTELELREEIRQRMRYEFGPRRRVGREQFERAMQNFPAALWQAELERYRKEGVITVDGDVLVLERDVWAVDERPPAPTEGAVA